MTSIERPIGAVDVKTLVREHILYGSEIPSDTFVTETNAVSMMEGIKSVVIQNSWLAQRYLTDTETDPTGELKSTGKLKTKEDKIYERFSSLFGQFELFCEEYYRKIEIERERYSVGTNWGQVEGLDRSKGLNSAGIAAARNDWQGSLGGGTPQNPLKIGGLVNRSPNTSR